MAICGLFSFYCLSAYLIQYALNLSLPPILESVIVWYAVPLYGLSLPWIGLLKDIGLTEGEWIRAPSFAGILILTGGYTLALYVVLSLFGRRR